MAMHEYTVRHRTFTCDKCGHHEEDNTLGPAVKQVDQTKWMTVILAESTGTVSPGNPLGTTGGREKKIFVCPGCRGMFEAFFEVKWPDVPSYGDGAYHVAGQQIGQNIPKRFLVTNDGVKAV